MIRITIRDYIDEVDERGYIREGSGKTVYEQIFQNSDIQIPAVIMYLNNGGTDYCKHKMNVIEE